MEEGGMRGSELVKGLRDAVGVKVIVYGYP